MEAIKGFITRKGQNKEARKASLLTVLPNDAGSISGRASPNSDESPNGSARASLRGGKNRLKKTVNALKSAAVVNMSSAPRRASARRSDGAIMLDLPNAQAPSARVTVTKPTFAGQVLKKSKKELPKAKATMARLSTDKEEHFPIPFSPPKEDPRFSVPVDHFPNLPEAQKLGAAKSSGLKSVKKVVGKVLANKKSMGVAVSQVSPQLGQPQLAQPQLFNPSLSDEEKQSGARVSQVLRALQSGKKGNFDSNSDSEDLEGSEQPPSPQPLSAKMKNAMSVFGDVGTTKAQRQPVGSAAKKLQEVMREAKLQQQMQEDAERRAQLAEQLEEQRLQPNLSNFQQLSKHAGERTPALEWQPPADLCSDASVTAEEILERLARVLVEKFGSLERTFQSIDTSHTGSITPTEWRSALEAVNLSLEEAIGVSASTIFSWIGSASEVEGKVTIEAWQKFFAQLKSCSEEAASLLKVERGSLRHSFRDAAKMVLGTSKFRKSLKGAAAEDIALAALGSLGALDSPKHPGAAPERQAPDAGAGSTASSGPVSREGSAAADAKQERAQSWLQSSESKDPKMPLPGSKSAQQATESDTRSESQVAATSPGQPGCPDEPAAAMAQAAAAAQAATTAQAAAAQASTPPRSRSPQPPSMTLFAETSDADSSSESSGSDREELPAMAAMQSELLRRVSREGGGAPPPNLKEVLAGKLKVDDIQPDDLKVAAAEQQLHDEIKELDISGVEALAYVLVARFGSLKKAFQWFDVTNHSHISHNLWNTGLELLRIDLEALTGFKPHVIFQMIDRKPVGYIIKKDWKAFFSKIEEGDFKHVLKRAGSKTQCQKRKEAEEERLAKMKNGGSPRKLKKKKTLMQDELASGKDKHAGNGESDDEDNADGAAGERLRRQRSGFGSDNSDSDKEKEDKANSGDPSRTQPQQSADEQAGDGDGLDNQLGKTAQGGSLRQGSFDKQGEAESGNGGEHGGGSDTCRGSERRPSQENEEALRSFREQIRRELKALELNECKDYTKNFGSKKCQIIMEVAEELGLWTFVQEQPAWGTMAASTARMAPCILVGHVRKFVSQTDLKLASIKTGESFEFPTTLSFDQRRVVHLLAASKGLWTRSEGKGLSRKVVACNVGDFAEEVRAQLEQLASGEKKAFPTTLSAAQRKVVHAVAAELSMWSHTQGTADSTFVEVFNLADFVGDVRHELESLLSGEQKEFSSSLSEAQRKVVHLLGAELGLSTLSQGDGMQRFVTAGNLADFKDEVLKELQALGPNQKRDYSDLTPLKRKIVIDAAESLNLRNNASSDGVEVWGAGSTKFDGNGDTEAEHDEDTESEKWAEEEEDDSEQAMIGRLFEQYATGSWNGHKIFLRFPDLLEFVEDMRGLMPQRCSSFRQKLGAMEYVYEDTVQLQMDLGLRASKGLTLKYFMVFVQRILTKMGWEFFGLLMTLLDEV